MKISLLNCGASKFTAFSSSTVFHSKKFTQQSEEAWTKEKVQLDRDRANSTEPDYALNPTKSANNLLRKRRRISLKLGCLFYFPSDLDRSSEPDRDAEAKPENLKMIDDQDLGFLANFLGIFVFGLVIAYHYVMADPKYECN